MDKKHKMSDFWNMGTAFGLGAGIGIVLGSVFNNVALGLCTGAGFGVVIGAIAQVYKEKKN